jgi:hypothetical protein
LWIGRIGRIGGEMPIKNFICPNGSQIPVEECLSKCPFHERCATLPYLRLIGFDREYKGITPSMAGNGARQIWLKATTDYAVDPQNRVWASLGIGTHGKLSIDKYTFNVLSEEPLSDKDMKGIPDILEKDENKDSGYILTDYKTWGSYKVAQALGLVQIDVEVTDGHGNPIFYASGQKKGQIKTRKEIVYDGSIIDLRAEEYQQNAYRIFYERAGFKINLMRLMVIPRDGGTFIAESRGIIKNIYIIPITPLPDEEVKAYYDNLRVEVIAGLDTGFVKKCSLWESWNGRRCNPAYCEVYPVCIKLGG